MISWQEVLCRLVLASFFGAMVGIERQRKDWAAGMRTHMMVCLGSSLIMIVSAFGFSDILGTPNVSLDPSRVAAQVVSGIGFIGAGTILFLQQKIIRGLTTAAGLWTVAAIGLAVGGGMYFAAFITTAFAIIILWVIQPLERKIFGKFKLKYVTVTIYDREKSSGIVNKIFQDYSLDIESFSLDRADNEYEYVISFKFRTLNTETLAKLVSDLQVDPSVKEITWNS